MNLRLSTGLNEAPSRPTGPVRLFAEADHSVYWVGTIDDSAFRCNTYLIIDGNEGYLVDPGNRRHFNQVRSHVSELIEPHRVSGLIICHQDPDVAASFGDWLTLNPALTVFTSPRTEILLPHYGTTGYAFHDVEAAPTHSLPSGRELQFLGAPFLHSPMAFATFDETSGSLFTGDVFAAVDADWQFVVTDFEAHANKMDLFHLDYMASGKAARGFARRIRELPVGAILPQHGSLIPPHFVAEAMEYLEELQCGLDLLYPETSDRTGDGLE